MNVGLRPLRMFLAVAKHGSFSRAAEEIGSSQSAVSLAVRHVEAELGIKLLDRTTRQVRLTTAGQALVATASRLISELDATLRELHDIGAQRRGKVMMACVPSVARSLMPTCIAHCTRRWPEVSFAIDDVPAETVLDKIARGDVEFGISSGDIGGLNLHAENLMDDPFLLVCRRGKFSPQIKTVDWKDLAGHHLIMLNNTSGSRRQIIDTFTTLGFRPNILLELAQPSSVQAMVEAGLGMAVLPNLVAPAEHHQSLVAFPLVAPLVSRTILLLRRRDRSLSPAAEAVWSVLKELFSQKAVPRILQR